VKRSILFGCFVLFVIGCGPPKERELKSWDLENIAQYQLSTKGRRAPSVHCADHLDARVGARTTCYMFIEGKPHDVAMTVTDVSGRETSFDIEVAETPRPPSRPIPADDTTD